MLRRRDPILWVSLLLLLQACGGASPVAPPPVPAEIPLRVTNGVTGAPVSVGPSMALPGAPLAISAPGFLLRETRVSTTGEVPLWPVTVDEEYVRLMVYTSSSGGTATLQRWEKPVVTVGALAPQWALDEVNALGLSVRLERAVTDDAADVRVSVDPSLAPRGHATRAVTATGAVAAATIRVRSADLLGTSTALHELGHALGLGHSPRTADLMHATSNGPSTFTTHERALLAMMYRHRKAGNRFPDSDQN